MLRVVGIIELVQSWKIDLIGLSGELLISEGLEFISEHWNVRKQDEDGDVVSALNTTEHEVRDAL